MNSKIQAYLFIALVFLSAASLKAEEAAIHPVDVDLRVYPGVISARFDTNKCYWFAAVLHLELPPPQWTDDYKEKIRKYVDTHFQLSVDGRPLTGRMEDIRYSEGFWKPNSLDARLIFDISYAVPGPPGDALKGYAAFFRENWVEEEKTAGEVHKKADPRPYETHLRVHGKTPLSFVLTLDKPDFEFPLAAARRTAWQARTDALWTLLKKDLLGFILAVGIAALIFRYRERFY